MLSDLQDRGPLGGDALSVRLRVLRISHSDVIRGWRGRQERLRERGGRITTVAPLVWAEGGGEVRLDPSEGESLVGVRTIGRHPILFMYEMTRLIREIRREKWDVLDVHEEPYSIAAAQVVLLARVFARSSAIICYSAQNISRAHPAPFVWLRKRILSRIDWLSVCSTGAAKVWEQFGFDASRISVVGLGYDTNVFHPPLADRPMVESPLRVVFAGRLREPDKGVEVLIRALEVLPGVTLDVVGDGEDRAKIEELVRELGIDDRVQMRGHLRPAELADVYRSSDVAVVPSIDQSTWKEQFGRAAVEAMACEVATVVSDNEALVEVVENRALIVRQGDVGGLSYALGRLRDDPEFRRKLALDGANHVRSQFTWSVVGDMYVDLYERAIHYRRRGVAT